MVRAAASPGFARIAGAMPGRLAGAVVAIGNFDGLHRGHQAVLAEALREARRRAAPALALTFEPHPREVFRPHEPLFRLTPAPLKAALVEALGFDGIVEQPFDADFAAMPAGEFVADFLGRRLRASHVVAGHDFHFGKGRQGTPQFLAEAGRAAGFGSTAVGVVADGGEPVSSSRIRAALGAGDVAAAAGLLGYRFSVEATVGRGRRLGRTLGFPTANMALPASFALRHGVYAVSLCPPDARPMPAVASFGVRPTLGGGGEPLLETFVFDWSGDLYGRTCRVSFFDFLRPELAFDGLAALTARMRLDEAEARGLLARAAPFSALDRQIVFGGRDSLAP